MTCHIALSGGFCTGKSSIIQYLEEKFGLKKVPDHTTRPKRVDESQGAPYLFLSKEQFELNHKAGLYYRPIIYDNYWYGLVESALYEKQWVVEIVSSEWSAFKKKFPDTVGIYLHAPPPSELERRAKSRGDDKSFISTRLQLLEKEKPEGFDHYIPGNCTLEEVKGQITAIVLTRFHCPCNSQKLYKECCKLFHDETKVPENALLLMRSRYSAYALCKVDYIINTTHPNNPLFREPLSERVQNILHFCKTTQFTGLDILDFKDGKKNASVTFVAHLGTSNFRERSSFKKEQGRWLYESGSISRTYP